MRGGSGVDHPRRRRGMEAFAQAMGQHEIAHVIEREGALKADRQWRREIEIVMLTVLHLVKELLPSFGRYKRKH
jgi:hypothetical protein